MLGGVASHIQTFKPVPCDHIRKKTSGESLSVLTRIDEQKDIPFV